VTYVRDIAPILERRCLQCHTADGPGHLPLQTYEQARHWARSIRQQVLDRRMPPWPAATGFADYVNDGSLTPIEIELLAAWAEGSAPLGTGTAVKATHAMHATRPSIAIEVPAGDPPRTSTERLAIPTRLQTDTWISGWSFRPTRPAVIQQIVFSIDGAPIGSWVPGDGPAIYPAGVAQRLPARSTVTAEVHYTKSAGDGMGGGTLTIFPGRMGRPLQQRTLTCGANPIAAASQAIAIAPLAPAGESVEITARRPDGTVAPLNVVLQSQPSYPITYRFRTPVALPRGTVVDVRSSAAECSATLDFTVRTPGRAGAR
jgi:hypothetical protein